MKRKRNNKSLIIRGESISPGVALGNAFVFFDSVHNYREVQHIESYQIAAEKERLKLALKDSERELNELIEKVRNEIGEEEGNIFSVHLGIIKDNVFRMDMFRVIEDEFVTAETAVKKVVSLWEKRFLNSGDYQLKEKSADILDVGKRILANLCIDGSFCEYENNLKIDSIGRNAILVTRMLLPSVITLIDKKKIIGIISELGNKASHSAVLAKSIGLPAVFGVEGAVERIKTGNEIILDGSSGVVFVNPNKKIKNEYESIRKKYHLYKRRIKRLSSRDAITKDGVKVDLFANIGSFSDVEIALKNNASGIGLYRTEMPFLIRNEFPSEDLQYRIYKKVIDKMEGKPINIRTLDLGGDKILSYFSIPKEENPNLGWRAIRVFLDHPDLFKSQLKAILRAGVDADISVIIPMVSDLSEIYVTKKIFEEAKNELKKDNVKFASNVKVGIMVEVPSAVILAEEFIKEVDFFSVGTNDLIQYTLAVDRNSEKVSKYFEPLSPAILRMLNSLIKVAEKSSKDITICGEIAGDPVYVPLLVGLGYKRLSLNPFIINVVKDVIRHISYREVEVLARDSLKLKTASEVKNLLMNFVLEYEDLFKFYYSPVQRRMM